MFRPVERSLITTLDGEDKGLHGNVLDPIASSSSKKVQTRY